jgi:formylglycine-generating enzyme required for sulfatase activity
MNIDQLKRNLRIAASLILNNQANYGYLQALSTSNFDLLDGIEHNVPTNDPKDGLLAHFAFVQGDKFTMGSESKHELKSFPPHSVTVSDFWLGKFLVTQIQWKIVMGHNPSKCNHHPLRPVETVSWLDVQKFIETINNLDTLYSYRLPTEAEWEYAAKGGINHDPYIYSGSNNQDIVSWHRKNSSNEQRIHMDSTKPVGLKKPNSLGIYDMTGNVEEWCQDYNDKYTSEDLINPCVNICPYPEHPFRTIRSGWNEYATNTRRTANYEYEASYRTGFRVVRAIKSSLISGDNGNYKTVTIQ